MRHIRQLILTLFPHFRLKRPKITGNLINEQMTYNADYTACLPPRSAMALDIAPLPSATNHAV
jgi:hypothetical protein